MLDARSVEADGFEDVVDSVGDGGFEAGFFGFAFFSSFRALVVGNGSETGREDVVVVVVVIRRYGLTGTGVGGRIGSWTGSGGDVNVHVSIDVGIGVAALVDGASFVEPFVAGSGVNFGSFEDLGRYGVAVGVEW